MARLKDTQFDHEIYLITLEGDLQIKGFLNMKDNHTLYINKTEKLDK